MSAVAPRSVIEQIAAAIRLTCMECGQTYEPRQQIYRCECGGLLDVTQPLDLIRQHITRDTFAGRLATWHLPERSGVWRYLELMGGFTPEQVVSKGEGNTTIYTDDRIAGWTGCANLLMKHEGENPTGSFKDRGMTVGITHARWTGAKTVACASSGNTSAAVAAYAATAGMNAITFIPEGKVAFGKLSQTVGYGARTVQVRGDFDAAMRLVEQIPEYGVYVLNSLNPFRLEGQKTIMFELLQQLDWNAPDWIAVPGGNLGNSSALGKALWEAHELGWISRMPRIAVIQATGANPFYSSYLDGWRSYSPVQAETVATAIRIGNPVNFAKAKRAIDWTNGVVVQVGDDEIMDAKARVDAAGIGCEPASAASIAGTRLLVEQGVIGKGDTVAAILTGHILKDPDSIIRYQVDEGRNPLTVIDPTLDALAALMR